VLEQIFVSNLPHDTTEQAIRDHFTRFGSISSVTMKMDRKGRFRCFCFIMMENADDAVTYDGKTELGGRMLRVNKAHQIETPRPHFERNFERHHRR
jgi:RNA recognition motif-containing protein